MKFKFSKALRKAQDKSEVSNIRLAQIMGVFPQQVALWRTKDDAKLSLAVRICDALDIDIIDFIRMGKTDD
ncbi:MAG: hypothetical protein VW620_10005 [Rhodospirillales bacterium]